MFWRVNGIDDSSQLSESEAWGLKKQPVYQESLVATYACQSCCFAAFLATLFAAKSVFSQIVADIFFCPLHLWRLLWDTANTTTPRLVPSSPITWHVLYVTVKCQAQHQTITPFTVALSQSGYDAFTGRDQAAMKVSIRNDDTIRNYIQYSNRTWKKAARTSCWSRQWSKTKRRNATKVPETVDIFKKSRFFLSLACRLRFVTES